MMKRFPSLVPDRVCTTPCHVEITDDGLSEVGEPVTVFEADLLCNFQGGVKTVLSAQKKDVVLSGVALFNGDIAPGLSHISGGEFTVNGAKWRIYKGVKACNPDGSVNYTRLELI